MKGERVEVKEIMIICEEWVLREGRGVAIKMKKK
jgi:hypothetical protein